MLVLEPTKRYSIVQIRAHRWMQLEESYPHSAPPSPIIGYNAKVGEFNEQILRIMQSLGIDQKKTMEVCVDCLLFLSSHFCHNSLFCSATADPSLNICI